MDSVILWEGPSRIDGSPIVAIATGLGRASKNVKTGPMVQTWILPRDQNPFGAMLERKDVGICGECPFRRGLDGTRVCYVNVAKAPLNVWKKYNRNGYERGVDLAELGRNRAIRLGAYGDPAAVPFEVWEEFTRHSVRHTGYTHQWQNPANRQYSDLLMASCESPEQVDHAAVLGFRSFLIVSPGGKIPKGMVNCPASAEAGNRTTCHKCGLCSGTRSAAKSVWIAQHK